MKAILKDNLMVLVPETCEERGDLAAWKHDRAGHVFAPCGNSGEGLSLRDLGRREDACREPINVTSRSPDLSVRLIGNFAATPFELEGKPYASVESFWQGLKFKDKSERGRVASLDGSAARRAGELVGYGPTITFEGRTIVVGTWEHWDLMERACLAKFTQSKEARAALLATNDRPLTHRVRRDSHTIPGVIMAGIWMKIREELTNGRWIRPNDC